MAVRDDLSELLRPAIEALGYEFVGLEYLSNPKNRLVRIYIDRAPEGIAVEDCATVSNEVSALLDVEDPLSGHYSLEVSSPGLERPLFELDHYRQFVGERVTVHLFAPIGNRRKLKGVIVDVVDDQVTIDVDGQVYKLGVDEIRRANLKPDMQGLMAGR